MARKQTARQKMNGVVGCGLLLVLLVVGVQFLPDFIARWNSEPFTRPPSTPRPDAFTSVPSARVVTTATRTNTPAPSPTFGWTKVPYDYSSATTEGRADLRTCPELICDVVVSVDAGHLLRIAHLVLGGRVDGNGDWFEVNHDGQLLYVPVVEVFTDTVTRMAMTASVIDVADEMVAMPADVVFYQCPQLDCVEAGTIPQGQRMLITKMVAGEMVGGIELWVMAVDNDGNEAYAPMVYVFPPTPTETATSGLSSAVCPRNCSTAVAMGMSDTQAGQCDNLDRDGDKVACYGD